MSSRGAMQDQTDRFSETSNDVEQRVRGLERRLTAMERLFHTAIGHDASLGEDSATLQALVVEAPGMSQTGVCRVARNRFGFSRSRVVEVRRRKALARASRCVQLPAVFSLRTCTRHARSQGACGSYRSRA